MLPKVKPLIVHSEFNIQRNDMLFSKKESEYRDILSQLDNLAKEVVAITQLSRSLYPGGEINKDKLFAIQRRQGALKRKLADMKTRASELNIAQEKCEKDKKDIAQKRKVLLQKLNKYQHLQRAERKQKNLKDTRIEEYEIEERISWQR